MRFLGDPSQPECLVIMPITNQVHSRAVVPLFNLFPHCAAFITTPKVTFDHNLTRLGRKHLFAVLAPTIAVVWRASVLFHVEARGSNKCTSRSLLMRPLRTARFLLSVLLWLLSMLLLLSPWCMLLLHTRIELD